MKIRTIKIITILLIALGLVLRIYHIDFGLPHSFYADEPEFTEPAINYTYEIRNIVKNGDYYKLIPISYVYGTFPSYALTASLMVFSKALNIIGTGFDKYTIFVFFRILMVIVSMGVIWVTVNLAKKAADSDTKNFAKKIDPAIVTLALIALNYKFIVHAHYVNADLILTLLLLVSSVYFYKYLPNPDDRNLFWSAIYFGLAAGTKITALITLPVYLMVIIKKRDYYGVPGFILSAALAFIITNPFSLAYFGDFSFRIYTMMTKEAGMVFDSVNYSPFKYIQATIDMTSILVVALFVFEIVRRFKKKTITEFDTFLLAQIIVYLLFFSIQSRRVDRWLLPVIPIVLVYASHGLSKIVTKIKKQSLGYLLMTIVFIAYMIKPALLLTQFSRWTPKSAAYIWARDNLPQTSTVLSYTEEGLDPLNKLPYSKVIQFNVYESEGAQLEFPVDPTQFEYVIIASRPMENFKRAPVSKKFPAYAQAWQEYEDTVRNSERFELIKDFSLAKPNLIPLSDVFIYKNLDPPQRTDLN